jgi:ribosomal protein L22
VWVNYNFESFDEVGHIHYEHARQYLDKVIEKERWKKVKKHNEVMYESEG